MPLGSLGTVMVIVSAMLTGAARAARCDAVPWPPPRDPAAVAEAESVTAIESLGVARAAAAATVAAAEPPAREITMGRAGLSVSVLDDEVRIAFVGADIVGRRWLFRGPFIGSTLLTTGPRNAPGRIGVLSLLEASAFLGTGFLAVGLTQDAQAAIGPALLFVPLMALTNHQLGFVVTGTPRRGPSLAVLVENRTDTFIPNRKETWLRW